ncbi:hypothetical protein BN136_3937 [Cronobacter universalis NCTC 9529]|nr:hypothetical protein BN136_3937 [Cronobacter universalis NCTC 9529]
MFTSRFLLFLNSHFSLRLLSCFTISLLMINCWFLVRIA